VTRAPAAAPRRRLPGDERRAAIVTAAAVAFARGGFAATSIADVSEAAGVSHLIVYRHHESKESLYQAVLDRAVEHLDAAIAAPDAIGPYGVTPAALLASARAEPAAFTVLWRHAARESAFAPTVEAARARLVRAGARALTGVAERSHRRWATRATVSYLVESVLVWIEDGDERLDDRFIAATTAALRAGVRAWSR
jgi:AcrR family transcriptional regulator